MSSEEGFRLKRFKRTWTTEYETECKVLAKEYGLDGLRQLSKDQIIKLFPPKGKQKKFDLKKFIICIIILNK